MNHFNTHSARKQMWLPEPLRPPGTGRGSTEDQQGDPGQPHCPSGTGQESVSPGPSRVPAGKASPFPGGSPQDPALKEQHQ